MDIEIIKQLVREDQYLYSVHAEIERKADELTFMQIEEALLSGKILEEYADTGRGESCLICYTMSKQGKTVKCNFCGSERFEERRIDYLYSYKGDYLLVPNTPVEVCLECGMVYYEAAVLKEIERRFFAIKQNKEQPDTYIQMPTAAYS